jgi:hypothetical protein
MQTCGLIGDEELIVTSIIASLNLADCLMVNLMPLRDNRQDKRRAEMLVGNR